MPQLPCFLCGKQLDQRTDKNGKAYFVCDGCGMQLFVRRAQGRENLDHLIRELKTREIPFRTHAHILFEIRTILQELDGIEQEQEKIDLPSAFYPNPAKKNAAQNNYSKNVAKLFWINWNGLRDELCVSAQHLRAGLRIAQFPNAHVI